MRFRACNTLSFIIGAGAILQFAAVSSAWGATTLPDAAPKPGIQAAKPAKTVLVFDWVTRSDGKAISAGELEEAAFKGLVGRLSAETYEQLARNRKMTLKAVDIVYIREPLIQSSPKKEAVSGSEHIEQSTETLRLKSPWVKIYIDRSTHKAKVIFRITDRQSLIDRIVRDTGVNASRWDASPLDQETFERYANIYADLVVTVPPGPVRQEGVKRLQADLPPDIFWLFQHSTQTTRGPFSAGAMTTLNAVINSEIPEYERRARTLVSTASAYEGRNVIVRTVVDIK